MVYGVPDTGSVNDVNVIVVCVDVIDDCRVYVDPPAGKYAIW
jgi:hypothetical protein